MKKTSLFAIALLLVLFSAFCCSGEESVAYNNFSGFLRDIQKTPPEIRLFTEYGEKKFVWIPEKTLFLDEDEKELLPIKFLNKFKNKGVTLLVENGKIVEIYHSVF